MVGRSPPSVVSAMVGGEHISTFGDNRVDFASFFVVLTLTVFGGVLKNDYKDAIHQQAQIRSIIGIGKNAMKKITVIFFRAKAILA